LDSSCGNPHQKEQTLFWYLQVTGKEIFKVLKEKHGNKFEHFMEEKLCPLAGDIMYENFGLHNVKLKELSNDIDIIVNGAATTNFYERFWGFLNNILLIFLSKKFGQSVMACRYDVAFDTNVFGAKHVCAFAKKCAKLKMLLHVSTGAKPYMFCALFLTVY
jgi:fatty acyl-CoA reductase